MTEKKRDFDVSDEVQEMTEATMLGALMQCVVEQCKALPKPWQALSEIEQSDYLGRVELQCRAAVKKAVFLICAQDRVVIPATVEKVVFKDGVQAVLEVHRGATGVHDLADAAGETVHILVVDTTALDSDQGKPKPEKDQRDLPLDDVDGGNEPEPEADNGGGGAAAQLEAQGLEGMPRAARDKLISDATDMVISTQIASVSFLANHLGVDEHVAGQVLAVLARDGVVSAPNHEGLRTVLVVDGEALVCQDEPEPEAEPPKGKRVCWCEVNNSEENGPTDDDPHAVGLQDCPGFDPTISAVDGSAYCKHCQHDEACHEIAAAEPDPKADKKPRRGSRKAAGGDA